jgi:colicin import membrane protein
VGRTLPWVYSAGLHALLIVLLSVSFKLHTRPASAPAPTAVAVQATVVDEARIQKEMADLEAAERRRAQEQQRQAQRAEAARQAREKEERRLAALEEQRKAAEQEAARKSEEARQQQEALEAQRKAAEEAAAKRQQELAKLEEQRKAEEARLAAVAKQRAEAEAKAKREAEQRKQRELEAELRDALAKEDSRRAAERSGKLAQYIDVIRQKVERNWARPASATAGLSCDVQVTQIPGGEVVNVRVGACNGDAAVVRSIENAVNKASPLPPPPDPSLFERELLFKFEPE